MKWSPSFKLFLQNLSPPLSLKRKFVSTPQTKYGLLKSCGFWNDKEKFDQKAAETVHKYQEKLKEEVLEGKRGSAYPVIKKMCARPHEFTTSGFTLPAHEDLGYSALDSAEIIASHFAKISQE